MVLPLMEVPMSKKKKVDVLFAKKILYQGKVFTRVGSEDVVTDTRTERGVPVFQSETHKLTYPALRLLNDYYGGKVKVLE